MYKSVNPMFGSATPSTGQIKREFVVGTLCRKFRCSIPKYRFPTFCTSFSSRFLVNKKTLGTVDNYKCTKPQRRSFHPDFSSADFEQ